MQPPQSLCSHFILKQITHISPWGHTLYTVMSHSKSDKAFS